MKISPRQIEKAMRRMGIQPQEIEAEEVVIKTREKEIVISSPQVARVNIMGQDTFQITGDVSERETGFSEEDVKIVMEKSGASREEALKALEETGDMAEAILKLKRV
jgi:nascent polypeptide-associated complex subunit alpha